MKSRDFGSAVNDGTARARRYGVLPIGAVVLLVAVFLPPCWCVEVSFKKVVIDKAFRSEGVAVADVNRDGKLDIIAGDQWYEGPNWQLHAMLGEPREFKQKGYSDAFLCFADDLTGDGWVDLIAVGFPGQTTRWLQNPGSGGGQWKEYVAVQRTGNESPDWVDVDGDGRSELVFVSGNRVALARPGADPTKPWPIQPVSAPGEPAPGHGIGVGDVNGDGQNDVLVPDGWWEGPASKSESAWTFHKAKLSGTAAQMCVHDFDGDGDSDVLSSSAHAYGIWLYEQQNAGWKMHEIKIGKPISQTHAVHLADINGDGLTDFVTGKRYWAHNGGDPGSAEPAMLCWFELQRKDGRAVWTRHDIDDDSGVGLHFQIVDINGDGLLDIATSNKKGVHLFVQNPRNK